MLDCNLKTLEWSFILQRTFKRLKKIKRGNYTLINLKKKNEGSDLKVTNQNYPNVYDPNDYYPNDHDYNNYDNILNRFERGHDEHGVNKM